MPTHEGRSPRGLFSRGVRLEDTGLQEAPSARCWEDFEREDATASTLGGTTATLASPRPLRARAISATQVELTWEDRSKGETSYRIEKLVDGAYREIRRVGPNQTRARVSGLSPGRTYTFRVRATSANSSSPYSNAVKVTTKGRAR